MYKRQTLTHPALSSMLSGLLPHHHGVHGQGGKLARQVVSLPLVLQAKGVPTGAFVANLCKLQPVERTVFHDGWDVKTCGMDDDVDQYLWDEDVVGDAIDWIRGQEGSYFAWVHLMDPHAEHRPPPDLWDYDARPVEEKFDQYRTFNSWEERRVMPPPADREYLWDLYAAEVQGVDRQLGRMLDYLETREDREETALIFSADHGEELYETWSRFDHGFSLTEGVLWVPLMVRAPGLAPGRQEDVVELLQVAPTVLDLMRMPVPYPLDGKSLLDDEPSRGYALSFVGKVASSLRTDTHRYWMRHTRRPWTRPPDSAPWRAEAPWFQRPQCLATYDPDVPTRVRWLKPQAPAHRPVTVALKTELERFLGALGPLPEPEEITDPDVLASFTALGYTDTSDLARDPELDELVDDVILELLPEDEPPPGAGGETADPRDDGAGDPEPEAPGGGE